ncbi:MAG: serine protease [Candidatus Eremiobacteraeota bacterium]|nr:serine protease [Candidatus Eremiobacteraeota bacterium]
MKSDVNAELAAVAARLRQSTVQVHDGAGRGSGSGIVWGRGDVVLTNAHVLGSSGHAARGSTVAIVESQSGRTRAQLIACAADWDLAALYVPGLAQRVVDVRRSDELVGGELVVAVGNPHGLVGAITAGLVQRRNARWVVAGLSLAPGNSGGPLADASGRVVGINSMVAGGYAYAVPSDAVRAFLTSACRGTARAA